MNFGYLHSRLRGIPEEVIDPNVATQAEVKKPQIIEQTFATKAEMSELAKFGLEEVHIEDLRDTFDSSSQAVFDQKSSYAGLTGQVNIVAGRAIREKDGRVQMRLCLGQGTCRAKRQGFWIWKEKWSGGFGKLFGKKKEYQELEYRDPDTKQMEHLLKYLRGQVASAMLKTIEENKDLWQ